MEMFTDEQFRIWDLIRLYKLILKDGAEIVDVTKIENGEYLVTLSVKKHKLVKSGSGIKGVCGMKKTNVSWYTSQTIKLRPVVEKE